MERARLLMIVKKQGDSGLRMQLSCAKVRICLFLSNPAFFFFAFLFKKHS